MSKNQEHSEGKRKQQGRHKGQSSVYKQNRQHRQTRPLPWVSFDALLHRFMACVNCGYFITAYRAHHGTDQLYEALDASNERRDGWLHLQWDTKTSALIHRFYSVRSDIGPSHLEFMCHDCQRKFLYEVDEIETTQEIEKEVDGEIIVEQVTQIEEQTFFQVELKLR